MVVVEAVEVVVDVGEVVEVAEVAEVVGVVVVEAELVEVVWKMEIPGRPPSPRLQRGPDALPRVAGAAIRFPRVAVVEAAAVVAAAAAVVAAAAVGLTAMSLYPFRM
jgi:hypothetical protein